MSLIRCINYRYFLPFMGWGFIYMMMAYSEQKFVLFYVNLSTFFFHLCF